MHKVLDKGIELQKSQNPVARACGKMAVKVAVAYSARIEEEVRHVQLDPKVMDDKDILLRKILCYNCSREYGKEEE